jgi:hypothetical protein
MNMKVRTSVLTLPRTYALLMISGFMGVSAF